jgi:cytochrome c oxidase subunit II
VRTTRLFLPLAAIAGVAASCAGPRSALVSAGRDAAQIEHLFIVMTVGALIIWAAVVGIAVYVIRVREPHGPRAANLLIIGGGVALPAVVLGALIAYGLPLLPDVLAPPSGGDVSIQVTAKQWWWRVQYTTPAGTIETANEVRLPVGQRIDVRLVSPDVIHSFWVPALSGKMDMIPGRSTRLALEPTRTGVFEGVCAEYCGASHAHMAFSVVVMEPGDFRTWLEAQARAAIPPADAVAARGQIAFAAHGCTACHTVRGTGAAGRLGPDLTHVASRLRIAAGTLPNEPSALIRWITEADRIKPGVHMPAFRALEADDVAALAAYLGSLR